ncbi:reverse transcriptase domain-containing protein, partial [Tanacetum coccineum]
PYEGASPDMRQHKSFDNVIVAHQEDIMVSLLQREKSLNPGFIGHISSAMHVGWSKFVMHVKEPAISPREMKHLKIIDYVSKWVEAQAFPTNDARNVANFLKKLFARFGIPKALISDSGTHFCNYQMERAMIMYGVIHRFSTASYPQTNRHVKKMNRAIKRILEKTIRNNMKEWSYKLDDALWAFQKVFKTSLGTNPFRIIYDKACYLPVELEHKYYWAIKSCGNGYHKKRTKNKAKNDKTKHGMEMCEKTKPNRSQKVNQAKKSTEKSNSQSQSQPRQESKSTPRD